MFFRGRKDNDPPALLTILLELSIGFTICSKLINLGVNYLMEVWQILLIIYLLSVGTVIAWRIWKNKNDRW